MKRWRTVVIVVLASALLFAPPLWSWSGASGVHSVIALFESHVHPDLPFDQFAGGRLGIIKPTWDRSYLYVAYRYLSGPGFDASEQKAMVSLWDDWLGLGPLPAGESQWLESSSGVGKGTVIKVGEASSEWLAARSKVPGVGMIDGIGVYRTPSADSEFYYANCNGSSFHTAAGTLDMMIGKFGLSSPAVKQWVNAQDQVFDNCSDSPSDFDVNSDAWFKMSDEWMDERGKVPGVGASPGASSPCKGMRFRSAALGLETIIQNFGASSQQAKQYVDAQDKALAECSSPAPPSAEGTSPAPVPDIPDRTHARHAVRECAAHLSDRIRELLRRELRHCGENVRRDRRRFFIAVAATRTLPGRPSDDTKGDAVCREK